MIEFFVKCDPPKSLSKNSKRAFYNKAQNRAYVVGNPKQDEAKEFIAAMFASHAPERPIEGPVKLSLIVFYPYPKSTPKKVVAAGGRPMVKTPDADGIAAGIMDVMTDLQFWRDDSQVYCLRVEKWEVPDAGGIKVVIDTDNQEVAA